MRTAFHLISHCNSSIMQARPLLCPPTQAIPLSHIPQSQTDNSFRSTLHTTACPHDAQTFDATAVLWDKGYGKNSSSTDAIAYAISVKSATGYRCSNCHSPLPHYYFKIFLFVSHCICYYSRENKGYVSSCRDSGAGWVPLMILPHTHSCMLCSPSYGV